MTLWQRHDGRWFWVLKRGGRPIAQSSNDYESKKAALEKAQIAYSCMDDLDRIDAVDKHGDVTRSAYHPQIDFYPF